MLALPWNLSLSRLIQSNLRMPPAAYMTLVRRAIPPPPSPSIAG